MRFFGFFAAVRATVDFASMEFPDQPTNTRWDDCALFAARHCGRRSSSAVHKDGDLPDDVRLAPADVFESLIVSKLRRVVILILKNLQIAEKWIDSAGLASGEIPNRCVLALTPLLVEKIDEAVNHFDYEITDLTETQKSRLAWITHISELKAARTAVVQFSLNPTQTRAEWDSVRLGLESQLIVVAQSYDKTLGVGGCCQRRAVAQPLVSLDQFFLDNSAVDENGFLKNEKYAEEPALTVQEQQLLNEARGGAGMGQVGCAPRRRDKRMERIVYIYLRRAILEILGKLQRVNQWAKVTFEYSRDVKALLPERVLVAIETGLVKPFNEFVKEGIAVVIALPEKSKEILSEVVGLEEHRFIVESISKLDETSNYEDWNAVATLARTVLIASSRQIAAQLDARSAVWKWLGCRSFRKTVIVN